MNQTKKNPAAVALGMSGGRSRAKQPDFKGAQAKGRATFKKRFKTEEERKAFYRQIGEKGRASRDANKLRTGRV